MPREQLDDSLFDNQDELNAELKRLAARQKKSSTKPVVHEIDSQTGRQRNAPAQPGPKRVKFRRANDRKKTALVSARQARLVASVVLLIGGSWFVGSSVYGWLTYDDRVAEGRELFVHEWTANDPKSHAGDGLGPIFNDVSCVACHFQGGVGGAGPNSKNVTNFEVLPVKNRPEMFASVIHSQAITSSLQESFDQVRDLFPIIDGGIVTPPSGCSYRVPAFDPVRLTKVSTPPLFGAGEIDNIHRSAIELNMAESCFVVIAEELNGNHKTAKVGRVRYLPDGRVGKFGWKAQFATLEEFVAAACAMECGLSNPLKQQVEPGTYTGDRSAGHDMNRAMLNSLVLFCADLPQPIEQTPDDPAHVATIEHGRQLFTEIGCAACHTPDIGGVKGVYSNFLLHVVEDNYSEFEYSNLPSNAGEVPRNHPLENEWKTPPLWGLADSAPYWHDGSSPTIDAAIRRHGQQAKHVTARYEALKKPERAALLTFLNSLKAPPVTDPANTTPLLARED